MDKKYRKCVRRIKCVKIGLASEIAKYESDQARVGYGR